MEKTKSKNLCAKTRDIDHPYEIYRAQSVDGEAWEWRVLKKYQAPQNEKMNPYARWLVAVKSPCTFGSWEYGDEYVENVQKYSYRVVCEQCTLAYASRVVTKNDRSFDFCDDCYNPDNGLPKQYD